MLYLISNIVEFADCQTACIHSILNVETVIFNQTTICASDYVSRTVSIELKRLVISLIGYYCSCLVLGENV